MKITHWARWVLRLPAPEREPWQVPAPTPAGSTLQPGDVVEIPIPTDAVTMRVGVREIPIPETAVAVRIERKELEIGFGIEEQKK